MVGEGAGARDMAVVFLRDRVGEGVGVVDGLSLAIQAPSTDESKCRGAGNRISPGAANGVLAVADDGRGVVDEERGEETRRQEEERNSWQAGKHEMASDVPALLGH